MADDDGIPGGRGPLSDPTPATTTMLLREIAHIKDMVESSVNGIKTRLDGMDKAMQLFNDNITRVPTDTDKQISHLKELHDEKFKSIDKQFVERDVRVEQTARDSKVAVDAALSAAKEAVGEQRKSSDLATAKSESSTTKQIDQINTLVDTKTNALNDKIEDLRSRVGSIEGHSKGGSDLIGYIFAGVGVLLTLVSLFLFYNAHSVPVVTVAQPVAAPAPR